MSEPAVNQQEGMKNKEVIASYFKLFLDERPMRSNFNRVKIGREPSAHPKAAAAYTQF